MNQRIAFACLLVSACAWSSNAMAQDAGPDGNAAPAAAQQPVSVGAAAPGRLARTISWAETRIDGTSPASDGLYPEFGGLITGAGIAIGPGYRRHLAGDRIRFDVSGARSLYGASMVQGAIEWPRLFEDRLSLGAQVKYHDFTRINFFGIGSDTVKSDQTDFRLKYVDVGGFAAVHPVESLTITGRAGLMRRASVGSGTSRLHPSIETRFDDTAAPGLALQPNYLHADVAIDADARDVPGYPSSGGRYRVSLAAFQDRDFGRYSFRRVEAEAVHYIPVTDTSVFSIRGRIDLTQTGAGQQVPFYLLPALGSGQSLRGYSDYRFRDRDLNLVSAEYRVRIARTLDAAVFYDAGKVAPAAVDALSMRSLRSDYGAGLRVHSARHLFVRLDVARSREGMQAIVSFVPSLVFSKRTVAPYVP